MTYFINLLFVPFYYYIIQALFRRKEKSQMIFFIVVGIHAILFRALANPFVYTDTFRYTYAFDDIGTMNYKDAILSINQWTGWGQGYVALNWIISRFTSDPNYLFIVLSVLSVGGVIWYYSKNTTVPLITMLLYLMYPMMYIMGFGVVRQHLAMVFILWALYFANNLKISIPLAIIAVLCHTSSLVFFPFYFLRNIGITKFNSIKLIIFSIIGFLLVSWGVTLGISLASRYEEVLTEEGDQNNIVPFIMIASVVLMFLITGAVRKIKDMRDSYIVRFMIYGVIIAIFGMTVPRAGRLSLSFIYCMPVALSLLYKYGNKNNKGICIVYTICIFLLTSSLVKLGASKYSDYLLLWK